ncbi:MAG: MotA/TolQ/ExbB proton channel family protein [Bryobacteraceae bacterium]
MNLFLLQQYNSVWDMVLQFKPLPLAVLGILLIFSVTSWAIIFSKWMALRRARASNARFLRAFRKSNGLEAVAVVAEQFRPCPLATVFDFGYEEVTRQIKVRGTVANMVALERTLQLGISEEIAKLERSMNWLATTATVTPFIGLFGTVWGIIASFQGLGQAGSASLRAVAPGISEALVATAMGLAAAIPAAIFYNHYGYVIREIGARMEDFVLEFLNVSERSFEE